MSDAKPPREWLRIDVPFGAPVAGADALQTMVGKPFLGLDGQPVGEVVGVGAGVVRIRIDDVTAYRRDLEATKVPELSVSYEVSDATDTEVKLARGLLAWMRLGDRGFGDPSTWEVDFYRDWRILANGCETYFDDEFEARACMKACREATGLASEVLTPKAPRERYPLRCEPVEVEYGTGHRLADDGPIKCRRVKASEIASQIGGADLDSYVERLDEGMQGGAVGDAWGDYESPLVVKRPGADEAFAEWCDRWLEVKAHINEDNDR